jgi:hypothetical protein
MMMRQTRTAIHPFQLVEDRPQTSHNLHSHLGSAQ